MTIQDLVDQAFRVDPGLRIEVTDYSTYTPNRGVVRETIAMVSHKDYGQGSAESVVVRMTGDQVAGVIPGKTTAYWQGAPLVEAFHALSAQKAAKS